MTKTQRDKHLITLTAALDNYYDYKRTKDYNGALQAADCIRDIGLSLRSNAWNQTLKRFRS